MKNNIEIFDWLAKWFESECDGDWEHENQIKIQTLDNPGWDIEIDLRNTSLENLSIINDTVQLSLNDWYYYEINNQKFKAGGDLNKLIFLISKFKEVIDIHKLK